MSIYGYTTHGFKLIDFNSDNWHGDEWYNWTLLDGLLTASLGDIPLPVVGGTANDITLDYTPNQTLVNGLSVIFIPTLTPTGPVTLDVDGQGPKPLLVLGLPVAAGDFLAGEPIRAVYDGTNFHTIAPLKKFSQITIVAGPSGATPHPNANDLTISHDENAGINILTPNTKQGILAFGDPQASLASYMKYDHATNILSFGRNSVECLVIDNIGLYLPVGRFGMNVAGANDFVILETSPNVIRLGSSGASNGLSIDLTTGLVTALNGLTVNGTLTATTITGNVNVSSATGVLPLANGGTGAATAPLARDNLGLGDIAVLDTIGDANYSGAPLTVANGGTGAATAPNALVVLGAQPVDADLTAIAALTTTAYGRSLLTLANAAALQDIADAVGLVAATFGTNTVSVRLAISPTQTLLIQGGTGTLGGDALGSVNFPTPYSVAPVALAVGGTGDPSAGDNIHSYGAPTTSTLSVCNTTSVSATYMWIAIGLQ